MMWSLLPMLLVRLDLTLRLSKSKVYSLSLDAFTNGRIMEGFENQATQALKNLTTTSSTSMVNADGSDLGKVTKTTVKFLEDMNDFAAANGIYSGVFGSHKPARSAVEVSCLPRDVLAEVEFIANAMFFFGYNQFRHPSQAHCSPYSHPNAPWIFLDVYA
ncbi:hypothetical protein BT96DRAFT_1094681 [Gymnopus androsaceus JB14]|uniref:Uncharacterized protein n=1 Tax=Gymnopus androsaceus JB14 TaxID=1447944 RepID=A0A6A4GGV2_9AGAR|nr:hypothetical protein BT96DRAFT_1094681 [Gymnopus androsaceus JB14]